MSQRVIFLTACVSCALGVTPVKCFCQDPLAKAVFQREATNAWQTYLARARHFQATWTESWIWGKESQVLDKIRHEVQHATDRALFLEQNIVLSKKANSVGRLWVVNPDYSFSLVRSKENSRWAVSNIGTKIAGPLVVIHGASTVGTRCAHRCVGSLLVEWLGGVMADVLQSSRAEEDCVLAHDVLADGFILVLPGPWRTLHPKMLPTIG